LLGGLVRGLLAPKINLLQLLLLLQQLLLLLLLLLQLLLHLPHLCMKANRVHA
jgi:hypothetical protein